MRSASRYLRAENGRLALALCLAVSFTCSQPARAQQGKTGPDSSNQAFSVPDFRHIDPEAKPQSIKFAKTIRFVTDADFPPFSYRDSAGALTGFSVALVDAVCKDLRLKCTFIIKPFDELLDAINKGQGDAIIAGLRPDAESYKSLGFTKSYFRSLARFSIRTENTIGEATPRALAGKRIGVVAGTSHEAFIKKFYTRSTLRSFEVSNEAREALRTGTVDAIFGDGLQLMFWIAGDASQGCCRFAAGAYNHPDYFSHGLNIAIRKGNTKLVEVLDHGLDRQQISGNTANLFRRFFPLSPW